MQDKNLCSGCSACAAICPQRCIEMKIDDKGFLYPFINSNNCIQCGACDKICNKAEKTIERSDLPDAYGAYTRDGALRRSSSSGGVFSVLAEKILEKQGAVVGASMSKDCYHVKHVMIKKRENLYKLRGSKYVQSDLGTIYTEVRDFLETGRELLFSGTPCQIDGLKAFLKKEYSNLLCVDLICHGVPSPVMWKRYCEEIERKTGGKIMDVNFRHKKYGWEDWRIGYKVNVEKSIYQSKTEDSFLRLFLRNFTLRPSCYRCNHKGINRKSDITLADFWGVDKVLPGFSDGKGSSLLLVHSGKGKEYVQQISKELVIRKTQVHEAINCNKACIKSVKKPANLVEFWQDVDFFTIDKLADKYAPVTFKVKLRKVLTSTLLYKLYNSILMRTNTTDGLKFVINLQNE